MDVDSRPGEGSHFWCIVPLHHRPQPAANSPEKNPAITAEDELRQRFSSARILLVEDNPINLEVALSILGEIGWTIETATNGRQALAQATAEAYDLILMDMQMPEMDGLEATQHIRQLPAHRQTPIIAMTANAFAEDRQRCLAAGMNDHLGKPVDPPQLYGLLLHWLDAACNRPY